MDRRAAEQLIGDLYEHALKRRPQPVEFEHWVEALTTLERPAEEIVRAFYTSTEYKEKNRVRPFFPPGHFHSAIVDPDTVRDYVARERRRQPEELAGIALETDSMRKIWLGNLEFVQDTPFTDHKVEGHRYHYLGGPFPYGDAITLRMMVRFLRPRRVVEIGSGFSSACLLDSADHVGLPALHVTCIDPEPDRLRSLLRPTDLERMVIIQRPIQEVSARVVDDLQPNDILFIDSTHVMKSGSDVHYEFFSLIPRLKAGVFVHFHDIQYPFEYPDSWIFQENYSWNETYVLRAFLMFNGDFVVRFWNSLFARTFAAEIATEFPLFLKNPGGSVWVERTR
jgi:hypothetical protein